MDTIRQCLSIAHVPCLTPAFEALKFICSFVEQVLTSKSQLGALAQSIAQLLQTLNEEYHAQRILPVMTSGALDDLRRLLDGISYFVQREASGSFLKLLFSKNQRVARIDGYYGHIGTTIESFQIGTLLNIHEWEERNDHARADDQRALNKQLLKLQKNHQRLKDTLNTHRSSVMAMIVSLQRRLDRGSDGDQERQFFSHVLRYLTSSSGLRVELQNWMITSYEVEFARKISSGGFGQVFLGSWNNTQVALKVLTTEAGITPSSTAIRQEIETWSILRHTHILQFLGANEFDDRPFIVMPYMKNGNARDYVRGHPQCNRLQIFHHISLGLEYLHSQKIVHGDLKALNVLIDGGGKAVLCDFGLSRIKADATSRTGVKGDGRGIAGSRNWIAPELLLGGSLKKPCDIYAFGMTIYEIFADEIPLCHINPADFIELVARQGVRPERPDDEDASQFPDAVWELAEECWVKNPKQRPTAIAVRDTISNLLTPTTIFQPTTDSPLSPCTALPLLPPQQHVAGQGSPPVSLNLPLNLIMQGHTAEVFCAAFSHDGKSIVSGSRDCTIIVWDAQTGNVVKRPPRVHTKRVRCVAFSPNGKQIVSGSADSTILVWDAATGQVVAGPFQGHTNAIWSVCFSPDGKKIASASSDQTIRVWDAQMGHLLVDPLGGHTDGVNSVAFSGDGKRLASGSRDRTIKIWDVKSGRLILGPLRGPECRVLFVAFSPDGKRTISASEDGDVCIWDTNTGTLLSGPSKQHTEGTLAVVSTPNSTHYCAVSPDGKWIALQVAGHCHSVQVWDSKTGEVAETFTKHTKHIRSVSFSSDSKRILSSSDDETVRTRTLDWYPVSLTSDNS